MYNTGKFNVCLEITREEQCLISYCDTVSIEPSGQNFQLYPNPVSDEIKIVIDAPSPGQYVINIISAQGGISRTSSFNALAGTNIVKLRVPELRKGIYFIRVTNGLKNSSNRFIKL